VRDEVDGLLFEGLDAGDLARQLDRLAGEPGLLERLQAGIEAPRPFAEYVDELEAYYRGERPSRGVARPAPTAVTWQGDHGLHTSLATINDAVADRIGRHGVRVQRVRRDGAALDAPLPHPADVEVRHQWPPDLRPPRSGRLAIIQPWEFGAIPADWVAPLQRDVDEVWVPSEYVRAMYLRAGLEADRVHVVPNGVDLDRFTPEGPRLELDGAAPEGLRFLFVGGAIQRKGIDVLLAAWQAAFAGRDDVTLVVKDFGSGGVYRNADRAALQELAAAGAAPRVVHLDADLSGDDLAALYRACDVLVHPYRGEGFAMPVLEAMASGLPVITTAGGPTDEFCPPQAGWRIDAARKPMPGGRVDRMETAGEPWMLEPSVDHLVALLRAAADATVDERAARGAAGRSAAERYTWDVVTAAYAGRVRALAQRPLRTAAAPIEALREATGTRVLATPAWRADDDLGALLAAWGEAAPAGTDATLFLLADPDVDGDGAALQARVIAAADAAGADLDHCADIAVLQLRAYPGRDAALHADADAYVPLHRACAGHERLARDAGAAILTPAALRAWLAAGERVAA
jgi:glycosyltransferase involved in cell wall biosynthesis